MPNFPPLAKRKGGLVGSVCGFNRELLSPAVLSQILERKCLGSSQEPYPSSPNKLPHLMGLGSGILQRLERGWGVRASNSREGGAERCRATLCGADRAQASPSWRLISLCSNSASARRPAVSTGQGKGSHCSWAHKKVGRTPLRMLPRGWLLR